MATRLNAQEVASIKYHLEVMLSDTAAHLSHGMVYLVEPQLVVLHILEQEFSGEAYVWITKLLQRLEKLDDLIFCSATDVSLESTGGIKMHPLRHLGMTSTDSLRKEYAQQVYRLSKVLGICAEKPGGRNIKVTNA